MNALLLSVLVLICTLHSVSMNHRGSRRRRKNTEVKETSSLEVHCRQYPSNVPLCQQNQAQINMLNAYYPGESGIQYVPNQQFGQGFLPTLGLFNLNQPGPALFNLNQHGMQFGPGLSLLQSGLQIFPPDLYNLNQVVRDFAADKPWIQTIQRQSNIPEVQNKDSKSISIDSLAHLDYYAQDAQNPNQLEERFDPEHILVQNIPDVPHEDNLNLSDIYNSIDMNISSDQLVREHLANLSHLTRVSFLSSVYLNMKDLALNKTQMPTIETTLNSTNSSVVSESPSQRNGKSTDLPNTITSIYQDTAKNEVNITKILRNCTTTPEGFTSKKNVTNATTNLSTINGTTKSFPWQYITQESAKNEVNITKILTNCTTTPEAFTSKKNVSIATTNLSTINGTTKTFPWQYITRESAKNEVNITKILTTTPEAFTSKKNVTNATTNLSTINGTSNSYRWQYITQVFRKTTLVPEYRDEIYNKLREGEGSFSIFLETAFTYLVSKPDHLVKLLIDQIKPAVTSWTKNLRVVAVMPSHVLKKMTETSHYASTAPIEELKRIFHNAAETLKARRKNVSSKLNAIIDLVDSMYNEPICQKNMAEDLRDIRDYPKTKRSAYTLILDIINNIVLNPFLRPNQHKNKMLADFLNMYVLYYNYIRNNYLFSTQHRNIKAFDKKSEGSVKSLKQATFSHEDLKQTVVNNNEPKISTTSIQRKSTIAYFLTENYQHGYSALEQITHHNLYPKKQENIHFEPDNQLYGFKDIFKRNKNAKSPTPGNLIITTEEPLYEGKKPLSYHPYYTTSFFSVEPSKSINYKNIDYIQNINPNIKNKKTVARGKTDSFKTTSKMLLYDKIRDYIYPQYTETIPSLNTFLSVTPLKQNNYYNYLYKNIDEFKPRNVIKLNEDEFETPSTNYQKEEKFTTHKSLYKPFNQKSKKPLKRLKKNSKKKELESNILHVCSRERNSESYSDIQKTLFKSNKETIEKIMLPSKVLISKQKQIKVSERNINLFRFKPFFDELELSLESGSKSRRENKKRDITNRCNPSIDSLEVTSEVSYNDVNTFLKLQEYDKTTPYEHTSHSSALTKLFDKRKEKRRFKNYMNSKKHSNGHKIKMNLRVHYKPRVDELKLSSNSFSNELNTYFKYKQDIELTKHNDTSNIAVPLKLHNRREKKLLPNMKIPINFQMSVKRKK